MSKITRGGFLAGLGGLFAGIALGKDKPLKPLHPPEEPWPTPEEFYKATTSNELKDYSSIKFVDNCEMRFGTGDDIVMTWDGTDFDIRPAEDAQ